MKKYNPHLNKFVILAVLLTVTACSTPAQQKAASYRSVISSAGEQLKSCTVEVRSKPEYAPLLPHLPPLGNGGLPTMAQMNDETYPTQNEKQLLVRLHDDGYACFRPAIERVSQISPGIAKAFADGEIAGDKLLLDFIHQRMTWGTHARKLKAYGIALRSQLIAAGHDVDRDLNSENQQEVAQRQAAANALMQWSMEQQMINSLNRPVVTNCTGMRNMVSCVSQ